tara:strand:- start:120 stop:680 length:561 start_codon:yes stop_codon:yes gene_type:complete
MSSIKLTADSGGGTFEIKAPSSSGNTRVLTLPDTGNATVLTTDTSVGKILQVVNAANTNQISTTSTSFVTTGVSVNITPASSSSKFLLAFSNSTYNDTNNAHTYITFYRGSTNLGSSSNGLQLVSSGSSSGDARWNALSLSYLDAPSTTSQITYAIYWKIGSQGGTSFLSYANEMPLSFTVMEIGT